MSAFKDDVALIRKALATFCATVVTGAAGVVTSNGGDWHSLTTQATITTILLLALTAAVAVFRIPNKYKPAVAIAEAKVAEVAGAALAAPAKSVADWLSEMAGQDVDVEDAASDDDDAEAVTDAAEAVTA